ncbi:MAG: HD domain-containing protein, partial [bacterium]
RELVRAAFLHDYFLYDWHKQGDKFHGYHHPDIAADNALRDFELTKREENIIRSHMWPLTFRHLPKSREAYIVSLSDKIVSTRETIRGRKERRRLKMHTDAHRK